MNWHFILILFIFMLLPVFCSILEKLTSKKDKAVFEIIKTNVLIHLFLCLYFVVNYMFLVLVSFLFK